MSTAWSGLSALLIFKLYSWKANSKFGLWLPSANVYRSFTMFTYYGNWISWYFGHSAPNLQQHPISTVTPCTFVALLAHCQINYTPTKMFCCPFQIIRSLYFFGHLTSHRLCLFLGFPAPPRLFMSPDLHNSSHLCMEGGKIEPIWRMGRQEQKMLAEVYSKRTIIAWF